MCGGFGQAKPADDDVRQHLEEVKPLVEAETNASYTVFEPVSYKTQVVAGLNYIVKVKVDGEEYIHVKIHKPLPCNGTELSLMTVESGKTLECAL